MYFQESDAIVCDDPDLLGVVEQIDLQLATNFSSAPLRATDFASAIGCDTNQVDSVFELLAGRGVLRSEAMVECERCENLMSAAAFRQAMDDEDEFECSGCGRPFRSRTQPIIVYRMTTEVLARPKPEVEGDDGTAILRALVDANSNVFRRRNDFWELTFEGKTIYLKHAVGLEYLVRLLMEPRRYIPAVTLNSLRTGIDPLISTGSSGPILDDVGRKNYERRYRELEEELDEARQNQDLGRIEKLESEMEQVTEQVLTATGLGGRTRELSDIEKVRKSVSRAVSLALARISKEHESLGRHLTTAITSGRIFRYAPERETVWLT
jgi:hypothetical protein